MFRPVSPKADLVAGEHEILDLWRDRRTFARLRAQNAGGPRWSFLDGPITANNPMGVHHAWGRTYKDLYQRFHAMLGEDQRWQNGFDCQGLWVEVNVERELGFTSKRDIEAYGIDRFVTLCKQRVLTYAARQTARVAWYAGHYAAGRRLLKPMPKPDFPVGPTPSRAEQRGSGRTAPAIQAQARLLHRARHHRSARIPDGLLHLVGRVVALHRIRELL